MKKIKQLFLVTSAAALVLLVADAEIKYCLAAIFIGVLIGIVLIPLVEKEANGVAKIDRCLSVVFGSLICAVLSDVFYRTWFNHPYRMKDLAELIFTDYSTAVRIFSILMAAIAIPSATAVFCLLVPVIRKAIQNEVLRRFSWTLLLKRCILIVCCLVASALVGYVLLVSVYLLPVDKIDENVRQSAFTMQKEGDFPTLSNWFTSDLDNYTDSIMLLEASEKRDVSAVVDAVNNPHGLIKDKYYAEVIVAHYIEDIPFDSTFYYARYWHGYLVWLKPLLHFMEYNSIRAVNGVIQFVMVVCLCFLLVKKNLRKAIIPIILAYLMLMPVALAKSMQFSSCFYVFMIGSICLLLMDKRKLRESVFLVFLFIGVFTAYFDFLTYPISTFGVPALIYLLLFETDDLGKKISDLLTNGFCWCLGYGGMWAEKWILASIVTDDNIIKNAIRSIKERTGAVSIEGGGYFGVVSCEIENYFAFLKTPVTLLAMAFCVVMVIKIIRERKPLRIISGQVVTPFVLVGLLPAVWYALALNHSSNHFWFTNKACVTSFLAFLFGLVSLV